MGDSTVIKRLNKFWPLSIPVWLVEVPLEPRPEPEPREPPDSPEPLPEALEPVPERASSCSSRSSSTLEVDWASWLPESLGVSSFKSKKTDSRELKSNTFCPFPPQLYLINNLTDTNIINNTELTESLYCLSLTSLHLVMLLLQAFSPPSAAVQGVRVGEFLLQQVEL